VSYVNPVIALQCFARARIALQGETPPMQAKQRKMLLGRILPNGLGATQNWRAGNLASAAKPNLGAVNGTGAP